MTLHLTGCEWPSAEHEPRGCPTPGACSAADRIGRLRAVMVKARGSVADDRANMLESFCVMRDGEPDLTTLSESDRANYIAPLDALLSEIDEALK